jgi:NTP pyrophosphatase (non-canonical NTP hydrolase)
MDILKQLKIANARRCPAWGHGGIDGWSLPEWACAVAGETGELCNLVKKIHRGDSIALRDVAHEAADIVIYLDMLCQRAGIDLGSAIVEKFNQKSAEINSPEKLFNY